MRNASGDPNRSQEPVFLEREVDLDLEDVRDSKGRRIDADYVARAVVDLPAADRGDGIVEP